MKLKYIGKSPIMVYDKGIPKSINPLDELELKEIPKGFEHKFKVLEQVNEKKIKKSKEDN